MKSSLTTREMTALYHEGLTLNAVGLRAGISGKTVWSRLNSSGIKMRPRGRKPISLRPYKIDPALLSRDYASGASLRNLSNKYGVSYETVRKYLIKNNTPLRPKSGLGRQTLVVSVSKRHCDSIRRVLNAFGAVVADK